MLSLENIKTYYPEHLWGFERFMLREYLQYKILDFIYESNYANQLVFMGGTALRILHGNSRFSEDLDFDNFNLSEDEFADITKHIKRKLKLEGYQVEIRNVYKGAYHCYIRFPKLLKNTGLTGHSEEKILIRLDTEAQHFDFKPELELVNKFDVFTEIAGTPPDILLSQKIYAIINRPRNKGRDFFDVVFLLGKNIKPNYSYLKQKLSISKADELKARIMEKLNHVDLKKMANDVKPFLFNTKDEKKVLLFEKYISGVEL